LIIPINDPISKLRDANIDKTKPIVLFSAASEYPIAKIIGSSGK
jgi:hypothetical protein